MNMQRDNVISLLKSKGFRITKQRLTIIDIILESECTCCKEICYKAKKLQGNIGMATVYRMMNTLEEIGAIKRRSSFELLPVVGGESLDYMDDARNEKIALGAS